MSKKKNTPISIYGKNKRLTDVIKYKIDGFRYRETISLDTANGDFGKSLMIEKERLLEVPSQVPIYIFKPITNKEELQKVQKDGTRMNAYGFHIADLDALEGAEKAFRASGMNDFADATKSWEGIPLPSDTGEEEEPKEDSTITEIEPNSILGNYEEIFKEHLKYPIDMFIGKGFSVTGGPTTGANPFVEGTGEGSQDYMFIEQFLYKAPQAITNPRDDATFETGGRSTLPELITGGLGRRTNLGDPMGSCILPVPNKLSVSQGVNWGEGRANAVELSAFQGVNKILSDTFNKKGSNLVGLLANGLAEGKKTFNTLKDDINSSGTGGAGATTVLNAVVARSILSRIGINVDVNQFITRETGAAINPNLELLFGGPQLRTFSFVFNFAPNSIREAKEVRMIHRWFRQGMLAQKTTTGIGGGSLFLGSPNVFRLCYKNNNRRIRGLNTFKICAVTSVQVDFTPDGVYQSYDDEGAVSQPVRSTMAVTFNELTPIFANDYNLSEATDDPSLDDLGLNISGSNEFAEDDLGF